MNVCTIRPGIAAVLTCIVMMGVGCGRVYVKPKDAREVPTFYVNSVEEYKQTVDKLETEHARRPGTGYDVYTAGSACPGGRQYVFHPDGYQVILCPQGGNDQLFHK